MKEIVFLFINVLKFSTIRWNEEEEEVEEEGEEENVLRAEPLWRRRNDFSFVVIHGFVVIDRLTHL